MKLQNVTTPKQFSDGFDQIREEQDVPKEFPEQVRSDPTLGNPRRIERGQGLDIPYIAIDPEGSIDLDQALHVGETKNGFVVRYAIADVAEFIEPSSALDKETHKRGVTLYSPDKRTPLHPVQISEDAASLLPGSPKPALIWTMEVDSEGSLVDYQLERSQVQVAEAISYHEAHKRLSSNEPHPVLRGLAKLGELRIAKEVERGGTSIALPSQAITKTQGGYDLQFEKTLPIERYNAQLSLLTGMAAGRTLLEIQTGVLRTLPAAPPEAIEELRRIAGALKLTWSSDVSYQGFVRTVSGSTAQELAFLNQATRTFKGAGYINLAETNDTDLKHNAIASHYAHVTAPLRRLVDRYNNEVLVSHFADTPIEPWVSQALKDLPSEMSRARQKASALNKAMTDYTEAMVLEPLVGQTFTGVAVNNKSYKDKKSTVIQLRNPAVITSIQLQNPPALGTELQLKLDSVDTTARKLEFTII